MRVKFYKNEHFNGGIHWNTIESKYFIKEEDLSEDEIKAIIKNYTNKEYKDRMDEYSSGFNIGNDKFILVC